jgi:methyl-accepting chemotaxis protein
MKDKHHIVKKKPEPTQPTLGEMAIKSLNDTVKQMRKDIGELPDVKDRIRESRELITAIVGAVPEVRQKKAGILVLHTADQIMADIASIATPADRLATAKEILKFYADMTKTA